MKKSSPQKGFSTIELLIAFSIAIIFISATMMVAFGGQTAGLDTSMTTRGLYRTATQIGDAVRSASEDWTLSIPPLLLAADSSYTHTNTDINAIGAVISPCIKNIESTVGWNSEHGRSLGMSFGTMLSNIDVAKALGPGGCEPTLPGAWDNPQSAGWDVAPAELEGSGTGIDTITIGGTNYAIITTVHPSAPKTDIWPIDISDETDPVPLTGLNTGKGLNGVAVDGHYAYVAHNSGEDQLQVIDLSNPAALTTASIVAGLPAVSTTFGQTTVGIGTMTVPRPAKSIAYYNGYVFIGTDYAITAPAQPSKNHEFHVYCVNDPSVTNCTPATPKEVASYNVNHNVNDIVISQKKVGGILKTFAFLATSDSTGGYPELTILDVTNAKTNAITQAGAADLPGNFYGMSVYVLGNTVYLGRERAPSDFDFYMFDIGTSISSPTILKKKNLGIQPGTSVIDMVVQGKLAFLIVSDPNDTFQVWDVGSDSTNIVRVNPACSNVINLAKSRAIAYKNDLIYVVNDNNAALNTIRDNPSVCTP